MKKKTNFLLLMLVILLVCVMGFGFYYVHQRAKQEDLSKASQDDFARRYRPSIVYHLQSYPLKRNISSVLLIGTDNYINDPDQIYDDNYYHNYNYADFLVILVFDHDAKTVTPFQINRDTMCDVPWLSVNGLVGGYYPMQITMAHGFGSGKQDSSKNVVNAVTGLLYGAPVDHYFTFTMDTVPILNDLVGGVPVTLEEDLPALGEKYVRGATITLRGREALSFVRTRSHDRVDANVARMGRQRLYMNSFLNQARVKIENNPEFLVDAFDKVERFLITDLTVENVSEYVDDFYHYEVLPIVTPTGTYTLSELSTAEFYPDEASLWDCVHSTFCP